MTPLTLRINHSVNPMAALADFYMVSQAAPYCGWTRLAPVLDDPHRAPASGDVPDVPGPIVAAEPAIRR